VSSYYSFPNPPEHPSEDFEIVSPIRAEDNAYSALDRLIQAAGLEQATRPQSPQVPVEQLSPLTLAPVPQPLTLVSSPTAPPSALFPPEPSLVDSPINYERVASQPSPFQPPLRSLSPVPHSPNTPALQYLRPVTNRQTQTSASPAPSLSPSYYDSDQENRPPRANPFQNPPCTRVRLPRSHPHQYLVLRALHSSRENWRPLSETGPSGLADRIPLARDLLAQPVLGSFATPFRLASPHTSNAHPTNSTLAERHSFTPITLCSRLGVYQPDDHFPFGRLCYSFNDSLSTRFDYCSDLIKLAFVGSLVLLYVHDFLDGRVCFIYGYLDWTADGLPFAQDVSYSFQDAIRTRPALAPFCLIPRLPLNPLAHISPPPLGPL
jgi:hypothetical protein